MLIARTFLRIFVLFVLGAPLLFIVGDLVEQVGGGLSEVLFNLSSWGRRMATLYRKA